MIHCIAIDDEPLALNLLADNISKIPYLTLIATCDDAFAAAKVLDSHSVDLIFIDIQMPGLTGLQFIESMIKKPMVIIVTAYKQYALEGYHLDVVDYLVKPVAMDRFMKACNKAKDFYELKNKSLQAGTTLDYMFVNVGYSLLKVLFQDIVFIEGLRDYIQIHLKSTPKPLMIRMSIKAMEEQLPASVFFRIHKSYIVSVYSITAIRKNSVFIGDREFAIGETYRDIVMKLISGNKF
jgi:DNA-binding LytR/AlgR family response regulator